MDFKYLFCFTFLLLSALPFNSAVDTSRPCTEKSDCHPDECCVNQTPPRGRRLLSSPGHCVQLGNLGSDCYVKYGSATHPPKDLVYGCPCRAGFYCIGTGLTEVPLGEHGICSFLL